jgi:lipopolysaccharide biosynthesis glycosyltransferase
MLFRAFNAGVLLMDLQRMREDGATAKLLALVQHCAMNDQDALNTYTRGAYVALDACWNAAPRQDVTAGAKIIHFIGPVKPWHDTYISRKAEFERIHERIVQRRGVASSA